MLDTIRAQVAWPLKMNIWDTWRFNLAPGLRVWQNRAGTELTAVECSLPKLLFGNNGRLLENQPQIEAALTKLREIICKVADVPEVEQWEVWRADLVWNYALPAKRLIAAHYGATIPGIRNAPNLLRGGKELTFTAAKSRLEVVFYDKGRQMSDTREVLRVEVRLCGDQRKKFLPNQEWKDFFALYRVYREILVSISPIEQAQEADWQEALAAEPLETRIRVLARLSHKKPRTFREYRRRVEAAAANLPESFSWSKVLPRDTPPAAINVPSRNRSSEEESMRERQKANPEETASL